MRLSRWRTARVLAATIAALVAHSIVMADIAHAQPVQLEVQFKVTDRDNKPIGGIPARVVLGPSKDWQLPDAGRRIVTDANGEFQFTTAIALEQRKVKRPTNFVSSLFSGREKTVHISVAAEMPYMQYHWLYVIDIDRFVSDGACLLNGFSIYSRDARGQFTRKAERQEHGDWSMPELNGLMMTNAGYEPSDFSLEPAEGANESKWVLKVAFKKAADAVRR